MADSKWQLVDRVLSFRRKRTFLSVRKSPSNDQLSEEQIRKGVDFEKFVVRRFNPKYFTLIEWRSDKSVDGIFPIMSKFPDLEFSFQSETESKIFAVECKWRESFFHDKVELQEFQIENYKHYESATGHDTFLILGIGNSPSNPLHIYILPMREISDRILHSFAIEPFRRKIPNDNFFLHCSANILR